MISFIILLFQQICIFVFHPAVVFYFIKYSWTKKHKFNLPRLNKFPLKNTHCALHIPTPGCVDTWRHSLGTVWPRLLWPRGYVVSLQRKLHSRSPGAEHIQHAIVANEFPYCSESYGQNNTFPRILCSWMGNYNINWLQRVRDSLCVRVLDRGLWTLCISAMSL